MGDSVSVNTSVEGSGIENSNTPRIIVILTIILAAFAPLAISSYGYYEISFQIIAILWMFSMDSFRMSFQFVSAYSMMAIFPFFLLRLALPFQIHKYYQGRTTRARTAIAAVLADIPFLILFIPLLIMSLIGGGMYNINAPLPIMMLVGLLILWIKPMPKPKVPWEEVVRSKSWWEEEKSEDSLPKQSEGPW